MNLVKKIVEEVVEGKLAYSKDALYAKRDQLLLEAGLRQACAPPITMLTACVIVPAHSIDLQESLLQQAIGSIATFGP